MQVSTRRTHPHFPPKSKNYENGGIIGVHAPFFSRNIWGKKTFTSYIQGLFFEQQQVFLFRFRKAHTHLRFQALEPFRSLLFPASPPKPRRFFRVYVHIRLPRRQSSRLAIGVDPHDNVLQSVRHGVSSFQVHPCGPVADHLRQFRYLGRVESGGEEPYLTFSIGGIGEVSAAALENENMLLLIRRADRQEKNWATFIAWIGMSVLESGCANPGS